MTPFLIITIYVCGACGVGSTVVILGKHIGAQANSRFDRTVRTKYIEALSAMLSGDANPSIDLPRVRTRREKLALITILTQLGHSYYGYDRRTIESLVETYNLDRHLASRARWSMGKRRALYIQLASLLPGNKGRYLGFERYRRHRNRYVRLYTLLHDIARQPEMTPQILGNHPHQLSDLELRQIVNTVVDSQLPLSMLRHFMHSDNHNLQFVGLELTQLYQPQQLNDTVLGLTLRGDDALCYKAIATTVKLHLDISNDTVARIIAHLDARRRRRIYRLCVAEGYSLRAFETINRHESDFAMKQHIVNMIDSRKRRINTYNN